MSTPAHCGMFQARPATHRIQWAQSAEVVNVNWGKRCCELRRAVIPVDHDPALARPPFVQRSLGCAPMGHGLAHDVCRSSRWGFPSALMTRSLARDIGSGRRAVIARRSWFCSPDSAAVRGATATGTSAASMTSGARTGQKAYVTNGITSSLHEVDTIRSARLESAADSDRDRSCHEYTWLAIRERARARNRRAACDRNATPRWLRIATRDRSVAVVRGFRATCGRDRFAALHPSILLHKCEPVGSMAHFVEISGYVLTAVFVRVRVRMATARRHETTRGRPTPELVEQPACRHF
jgi:hypothetical protein